MAVTASNEDAMKDDVAKDTPYSNQTPVLSGADPGRQPEQT